MDKIKKDIIALLKENSRLSTGKIATMLNISQSEVESQISKMEESGVIVKYNIIIDEDKIDEENVQALIEVRVAPQKNHGFDAISEEILKFEEVKSLYLMSGGYDLAVFVEGKSLKQVAGFVTQRLSTLDMVLSTATHFILKKYKIEGAVTKKQSAFERLAIHP